MPENARNTHGSVPGVRGTPIRFIRGLRTFSLPGERTERTKVPTRSAQAVSCVLPWIKSVLMLYRTWKLATLPTTVPEIFTFPADPVGSVL
jgi:hypothetical protein